MTTINLHDLIDLPHGEAGKCLDDSKFIELDDEEEYEVVDVEYES